MSVKVGDVAPDFSGTDLVKNAPWSLYAQKKATVFLSLAAITGAGGDVEAAVLEDIWTTYNGNTIEPFTMALIGGYAGGGGQNPPSEKEADLKAAIAKAKISFPVILSPQTWGTYTKFDVSTPAWYCLHWDDVQADYICIELVTGNPGTVDQLRKKLTDMLNARGVKLKGPVIGGGRPTHPLVPPQPVPTPMIMFFLGSPTTDGGGVGIPFGGGRPIPIDPGPFHDALAGLSVVALAEQLGDAGAAAQMRRAGIETAKSAVSRL
jgi:hypothetical protein